MVTDSQRPAERRPIPAREHRISKQVANLLARTQVSPNTISVAGMICALGAAASLAATAYVSPPVARLCWLLAGVLILLRLLANMFDGMVAVATGQSSAIGELFNEIPDRISDSAVLVGMGYALGGLPALGYLAALLALFTAYVRALGNSVGVSHLFMGPLAKQQRMFAVIGLCVYMSLAPRAWQPQIALADAGLPAFLLALVGLGTLLTAVRRIRAISGALYSPETRESHGEPAE